MSTSPPQNSTESSSCPTPNNEATLSRADIERLGRQRPAAFHSLFAEVGFVSTIVFSSMLGEFMISGFNIVLPAIVTSLHIDESETTWPAAAINLTTASFLLPFARMTDRYGGRSVFLGGHLWMLVWTVISGFSQNTIMLILCRGLQGLGSAAFQPSGLALLAQTYRPGPRKNLVFSIFGAFAAIGFYFGIFIGALAAEYLNWRWFFWLGAFVSLIVTVMGVFFIPKHVSHSDPKSKMDWWGLFTIVPGLILVVFALTDASSAPQMWRTPYIPVTLALGVLFLGAAVYVEGWVAAQPLLPAEVFRVKYMKRLMFGLFCAYGVFGLFLLYSSFYIEVALGIKPILTAAWFTPMALGGVFLAISGGLFLHRIPGRVLMIVSSIGFLLSVLLFALIPNRTDGKPSTSFIYWAYVFTAMVGATVGVDITYNISTIVITTAMPQRLQSTASGIINSLLTLGIAFWLGVGDIAVSTARAKKGGLSPTEQYRIGFWTATGLAGLVILVYLTIPMGKQSAELTADEKAELESELIQIRSQQSAPVKERRQETV